MCAHFRFVYVMHPPDPSGSHLISLSVQSEIKTMAVCEEMVLGFEGYITILVLSGKIEQFREWIKN